MSERAISIQHPRIAFDGTHAERAPAGEQAGPRALLDAALRGIRSALRFLGELAAAGGPLS
jgi:hypothetical protein